MNDSREKLRALEEQIHQKHRLESRFRLLQKEEWELRDTLEVYARQAAEEQEDVDALTGRTLKGFLARLQKNTYQDTLTREQAEAAAAIAKLEDTQKRLLDIEAEKKSLTGELRLLKKAEQEYERCLEERRQWLNSQSGPIAEEMARLETEAEQIRNRKREVNEAVTAGRRVKQLAAQIDRELSEAEGWGAWDTWGGGPMADMAKYDHLDKAGSMSQSLRKLVSDFQTELADVALCADISVEIDEFTRFADFFWDGVFVDLTVLNRIRGARSQVRELEKELEPMLEELGMLAAEADRALAVNEAAVRRLTMEGEA